MLSTPVIWNFLKDDSVSVRRAFADVMSVVFWHKQQSA